MFFVRGEASGPPLGASASASYGYADAMRFKLGIAIGFAAGYWYASMSDEERKRQLDEALGKVRENPRVQRVGETVSANVAKITDAIESRAVTAADGATDSVASTVAPDGGSASSSPSPSPSASSSSSSPSKSSSKSKSSSSSSSPSSAASSAPPAEVATPLDTTVDTTQLPGGGIG